VGIDTPREVLIQSTWGADLVLDSAPMIDPLDAPYLVVNPRPDVAPRRSAPDVRRLPPTTVGPAPHATLSIHSNDPDRAAHLRLAECVRSESSSPNLVISPDPIDFSRVPRGTRPPLGRLLNVGGSELQVTEVRCSTTVEVASRSSPGRRALDRRAIGVAAVHRQLFDDGIQSVHGGRLRITSNDPVLVRWPRLR